MIVNLTQHPASPDQIGAGVVDLRGMSLAKLREALTFHELPDDAEIVERAWQIALIAAEQFGGRNEYGHVNDDDGARICAAMIGGAPYLMPALEAALRHVGIMPRYSFTRRETVEEPQPDGTVRKTAVFRHMGWVLPPPIDELAGMNWEGEE